MKEFKINKYLTLKLEWDNKTYIYVNKEPFMHCKYLLLNLSEDENELLNTINSVDDAEEKLDKSLELPENSQNIQIDPETEFWAHCSNLQAWAEYGYDTRLLHRNLAFPLLHQLAKSGDKLATIALKEEIADRLNSRNENVVEFLINEGYIDYLSHEEHIISVLKPKEAELLLELEQFIEKGFFQVGGRKYFDTGISFKEPTPQFLVKEKSVIALLIYWFNKPAKILPESIGNFENLEIFRYVGENIGDLPKCLFGLKNLKELSVASDILKRIPNEITKLVNLEKLHIYSPSLIEIPSNIGDLSQLKSLSIGSDSFITPELPISIKNLKKIESLSFSYIKCNEIPNFFKSFANLKNLTIYFGHLKKVPKFLFKWQKLEHLDLSCNDLTFIPEAITDLKNLSFLSVKGNSHLDIKSKKILEKLENQGVYIVT